MENWAEIFRKVCPKTRSTHVWILLGTILGVFGILKNKIFENFRKLDPPWNTGHKFFRKNHHKTRLDTFGNTFGLFWNFENIFFRKFSETRYSMENWAKIFQKNFPKTCSKHVWIHFGTLLGIFGILKMFFFENFRKFDSLRNIGQKNFSKNLPQNTFKTRLAAFGNDFGHFWNFEKKSFLKIFENSTLQGTPGINFFQKNHPKTRLDTFGNTFGHFWNFENILIFF